MRRLFPPTPDPTDIEARSWSLDELADAYAYPGEADAAGPPTGAGVADTPATASPRPTAWLRANMVASLDGAAYHDGRSQPLSSDADMRIFGVLRGLADAIVVGAQTVRQEGYRPAKAREAFAARRAAAGQSPAPAIAVVSASLDLDFSLPLFTAPRTPTLVLTGAGAPAERVAAAEAAGAVVVRAGQGARVDPGLVKGALAERGLTRLLTEGGPTLLGQFVAAGALDELCLSVAPLLASGEAARVVNGPALTVPERFSIASVMEEDGFLFTRYRRF
ncbi:pyrimidine reductase family protein [Streptomyces sp. AC536]|uniref:pyrimidine reductase family protein n=1 Tax=Streptomyces buecherae TaxID=2763006 RepID=UPI00164EB5C9|nr:pyrimidine reductase family protein [Streptomyces buecherae]MBC3982239.1 pyrimidine reductase family protein [Streptomyces buecherae]QNJ39556.1 pyrimidine reductase family protein [Streptomyces buecherae]